MTAAHRARLIAALARETGLEWRRGPWVGSVEHAPSGVAVGTAGWTLTRREGSLHQKPDAVLRRWWRRKDHEVHLDAAGRGWPERLAAAVARKIEEVSSG